MELLNMAVTTSAVSVSVKSLTPGADATMRATASPDGTMNRW